MTNPLPRPSPSDMYDTDVRRVGVHLEGKDIALVITGGVAAIKAPFLIRALRAQGARVVPVVSQAGLRFVTQDALEWSSGEKCITQLSAGAEHLSDRRPFDAYLVAPATYNLINKLAAGVADDVTTTVLASALYRIEQGQARLLIAPTMNGVMHNQILDRSMNTLAALGAMIVPSRDDYGKHNLPAPAILVAAMCRSLSTSPLKATRILVTGGPTPVPIDSTRYIANRFRGRLAIEIVRELYLRGAEALLIQGDTAGRVPGELPVKVARTYDDYRTLVLSELESQYDAGIFTAGVADYAPCTVEQGKIPSGAPELTLRLRPTPKVIQEVRRRHPDLYMITCKYQPGVDLPELFAIGGERLATYDAVVVNRDVDMSTSGQHRAWILTKSEPPAELGSKTEIALAVAEHLEREVRKRAE